MSDLPLVIELVPYDNIECIKTATAGDDGRPIMWAYAYRIGGVLLDTGCANALGDLEQLRVADRVDRVYLTHEHEDHVGACSYFARKSSVFAPKYTIDLLRDPPTITEFFRFVWGQPEAVTGIELVPPRFSVGDLDFQVIPLTGHGREMVGFYEARQGWLFSADSVPPPSKKFIAMNDENIPQMISTMEKILELDVKVLFDGHKGPIESPEHYIRERVDYLKEIKQKVKALHESGTSEAQIQIALDFKGPWYLELTKGRFGIDLFIKSLVFDTAP